MNDFDNEFTNDENESYFKQYSIHSSSNIVNIKYGVTKRNKRNLIFETYFGIGVRHINSESDDIEQAELDNLVNIEDVIGGSMEIRDNTLGSSYYFNITAGIKIGLNVK